MTASPSPLIRPPPLRSVVQALKHWASQWGGYALGAGGAFLFSTKGIFIKLAFRDHGIDATGLMVLRQVMSVPFFVIFGLYINHRMQRNAPEAAAIARTDWLKAMLVGIIGYWLASFTDFMALKTLTPQFERLVLFTYPAFVLILGALFFRQPIRRVAWVAFFIAYSGLFIVFLKDMNRDGFATVRGTLWCLGCAVSFALYLLLARGLIRKMGAARFTAIAMTSAAAMSIGHQAVMHGISGLMGLIHVNRGLLWLSLGLALVATVAPVFMINSALGRITSQAYAIIGFISPVCTSLLSVAFIGEQIGWVDVLGTLLVIAGISIYSLSDRASGSAKDTDA